MGTIRPVDFKEPKEPEEPKELLVKFEKGVSSLRRQVTENLPKCVLGKMADPKMFCMVLISIMG